MTAKPVTNTRYRQGSGVVWRMERLAGGRVISSEVFLLDAQLQSNRRRCAELLRHARLAMRRRVWAIQAQTRSPAHRTLDLARSGAPVPQWAITGALTETGDIPALSAGDRLQHYALHGRAQNPQPQPEEPNE